MKPNEFKIELKEGMGKRVAQIICEEIKESLSKNKAYYDRAKRNENMYQQRTKWMQQNKTCNEPWPNAADYFVPLTEWIVDAIHARVFSQLFSQEPYLQAVGVESNDVDKASSVTDFVDTAFREIVKVAENTNFFFKQMIKLPFSVLKYDTVKEYDRRYVKDDSIKMVNPMTQQIQYILPSNPDSQIKMAELIANGYQPAGMEKVWVKEEVELESGPRLQYINFEDYVWAPGTKKNKQPYWEGNRDWLTANQIRLKAKQGIFDKQTAERIVKALEPKDAEEGANKDIAVRSARIECFHWYGRLPFNSDNQIDFDDPDSIEQEAYVFVDYKDTETLQALHWYHERDPYPERVYIRDMFEDTDGFDGRSICDKLYKTQAELNKLHNTIINNAMIAMQKIFVKKRGIQDEDWEKPMVYPGAIWEEDMPGDIRVLEVGDVKSIGMELEASLINFAERLTNISIYQTGTARQEGGKTAHEVQATISEGNIGLDMFIQRCFKVLRVIAKWTVSYFAEDMPIGMERRIRGDVNELIFPTEQNMILYQQQGIQPVWTRDDLTGKFDFKWDSSSLNNTQSAKIAMSNDLMQNFMPQPMIQGNMMATWEILKKALMARGIKDWQKILPPRQAIVQEMQNMQMQQQLQQKQEQVQRMVEGPVNPAGVA